MKMPWNKEIKIDYFSYRTNKYKNSQDKYVNYIN